MISKPTDLIRNFFQMILYDIYRTVKSLIEDEFFKLD